jgi:hypothetical protein
MPPRTGAGTLRLPDQDMTRWLGDALEGGYQQPPIEPNRSAMAESPVCSRREGP